MKTKYSFVIFFVLFALFFQKAYSATLVDYTDLSPSYLNTPNDLYPYKAFVVEPTEEFVFNNIQVLVKTSPSANPFIPLTFCLWELDEDYLMQDEIVCSNTKYNASDIPTTYTIKDFDFKDTILSPGNIYAFIYGPDEYAPFLPSEMEGKIGYAHMSGPGAGGINKNAAWFFPWHLFLLFDSEASIYSINSDPFFAKTKNKPTGYIKIHESPNTTSSVLKQLPMDWSIEVLETTNEEGYPVISNGYRWYKVKDRTDDVVGWMTGATSDGVTRYLSRDTQNQEIFENDASSFVSTTDRPNIIIEAIDHYYNNEDENYSLYSSNDGVNNISVLKERGFPEKVIWGIAAQESGPSFNNEIVSFDYGHGITQITPYKVYANEATGNWANNSGDNRGIGSGIKIPPCKSDHSNLYVNCYENAGTHSPLPKPYKNYAGILTNPKYKYYSNTKQSIFSNIKDGMRILQEKYGYVYNDEDITIGPYVYTPEDRDAISVVQYYNGSKKCGYVKNVSLKLQNIDDYFPGQNVDDIMYFVDKMYYVSSIEMCSMLHSPGELVVIDKQGSKVGVENGKGVNGIPFSVYDKEKKYVNILNSESSYFYKVVGTGSGVYGLEVNFFEDGKTISFNSVDIPIKKGEVHLYYIDKYSLSNKSHSNYLEVDKNNDGIIERKIILNDYLTKKEFIN